VFWGLDGYFLRQERLFRKLYDHVRKLPEEEIDFSMDLSHLNVVSWFYVLFSKTLIAFHGVVIISIIVVMLLLI